MSADKLSRGIGQGEETPWDVPAGYLLRQVTIKPRILFRLTFEVVTEASAEHGENARHGFVTRNLAIPAKVRRYIPERPAEFPLRDAIRFLLDRNSEGPVQCDSYPVSRSYPPRWFTYGGGWNRETGESVSVSLHMPDRVTAATRLRIARVLKCYGVKPAGGAK